MNVHSFNKGIFLLSRTLVKIILNIQEKRGHKERFFTKIQILLNHLTTKLFDDVRKCENLILFRAFNLSSFRDYLLNLYNLGVLVPLWPPAPFLSEMGSYASESIITERLHLFSEKGNRFARSEGQSLARSDHLSVLIFDLDIIAGCLLC